MTNDKGHLYLIPTRLGENPPLEVLPLSIKKMLDRIDFFIVENEKTARRFIKKVHASKSQSSLKMFILNKFTQPSEIPEFLKPCLDGRHMGLLSEAGCPGIADPGAEVVKLAHELGIRVVPIVGPSSIILALMGSGMNGQHFTFNGYLPIDRNERKKALKTLERTSASDGSAQLFIETPYRNNAMLDDIRKHLRPETRLCVACDLTLPTEYIRTLNVSDGSKTQVDLHKRPTVFIIQSV